MSKKQLIMDFGVTFNRPEGQNTLLDLRKKCPLMDNALDASKGIDVNKLCYLEGQRSVLLYIYKMLDTDPYDERQRKAITESRKQNANL